MALKMALNMAQYGHYWAYPSYSEAPFVGTLNLCQEVPDTMTNKLGHLHHPILRKRTKYGKNIDDFLYFEVFSDMDSQIELNPFAYYQRCSLLVF